MTEASAPKLQLPDHLQRQITQAFCDDLFKACPELKGLSKKQWKTLKPEIDELYKVWWERLWTNRENVPLLRQILRYCLKDRIIVTPNLETGSVTFKGELINGSSIEGAAGAQRDSAAQPSARISRRPVRRRRALHHYEGGTEMENVKMSLCPMCDQCPEVAGDEVRIGEAGNLVTLKKDEWNVLVDLIQSGQLSKV